MHGQGSHIQGHVSWLDTDQGSVADSADEALDCPCRETPGEGCSSQRRGDVHGNGMRIVSVTHKSVSIER